MALAGLLRLRTLPWAALLQVAMAAREHWDQLSERDRSRLRTLVRESRGWPGNLTNKEREELRRLVGKLDLPGVARDAVPLARGLARRRRK